MNTYQLRSMTLRAFLPLALLASSLPAAEKAMPGDILPAPKWTPSDGANHPMGQGVGINPGRVTWARDLAATPWDGKTGN